MKLYYVYLLVLSLYKSQPSNAVATCQPLSEIKGSATVIKNYGETFTMRCPSHPCTQAAGDIYNFTGDSELIHQGRLLSKTITDINDAAMYCCAPHCANNTEPCCLNVGVQSEITFHMDDTPYTHQNYTASCTVTAKPRMNLYIYTQGCDFKSETLWIDEYTTKAIIMIYNITSDCRKITCATNLSQKSKTVGLLPPPEHEEAVTPETLKTQLPTQLPTQPPQTETDSTNLSNTLVAQHQSSDSTEVPPTAAPTKSSSATNLHKNFLILITITAVTLIFIVYL